MVTLSDLASDIAKNACESGAAVVELEVMEMGSEFRFSVKDNGKGMSGAEARRAVDPFEKVDGGSKSAVESGSAGSSGKIGIGIPFLIQTVNEHAGGWNLNTEKGTGTTFSVWFDIENISTPPVGDLASLFCGILVMSGPDEIIIRRLRRKGTADVRYEIRKTEIAEALGGIEDSASIALLATYLRSLEENKPATL
jgi:hypothetical protein